MNAQRFYGYADGPDLVIDRASDGSPLEDCCGWTCACCETIYAKKELAESCCGNPSAAEDGEV